MVLGEGATYAIPELEFEVPEKGACLPEARCVTPVAGEAGSFTTIEGLLSQAIDGLSNQQPQRKASTCWNACSADAQLQIVDPEVAEKIDAFIVRLQGCLNGTTPFTFVLSDPTGNSHIENTYAPNPDPGALSTAPLPAAAHCSTADMTITRFPRTPEMNAKLGITSDVTYVDQATAKLESAAPAADGAHWPDIVADSLTARQLRVQSSPTRSCPSPTTAQTARCVFVARFLAQ